MKTRRRLLTIVAVVATLALLLSVALNIVSPDSALRDVLSVGFVDTAYAAETPDYYCDGADDDVQFQAALDALPVAGGEVRILSGAYSFSSTVSRAIDGVIFSGTGKGATISYNGSTAVLDAGSQAGWVFQNFSTDAGEVDVSSASEWKIENVWLSTTYVTFRASGDVDLGSYQIVNLGDGSASSDAVNKSQLDTKIAIPVGGSTGEILFYNGSIWAALSTGTSGYVLKTQGVGADPIWQAESDPTFPSSPNQGNILFYDGANWVSLAPGTGGYSLRTQGAGADPIWQAIVISNLDDIGDVASITEAQGQIIYYDGANWNVLNPGSDGQYLKTQGAGNNPVWTDVAGGGGARSSTVTVAANGAVNASEYDYQCNGTADDVEINAALTAGAGGLVVLSEGGYQITANLTVPASTYFAGAGMGSVLTTTDAVGITNMVVLNGDNIDVSDMKLVLGAGAGDAGTRPNVVYATTRVNIRLENLWIVGDETVADDGTTLRQNGIVFIGVSNSEILNSYILDNKRNGIYFHEDADYNLITGNVINSNTKVGTYLSGSDRCRITSNNFFTNGDHGLRITGSHYSTITSNVFVQNVVSGIYLSSSNYTVIGSNALYFNYVGIHLVGASHFANISNNVCHGHTTEGIKLDSTDRCTIVGNFAYNADHGLLLTNGSDNNTVTGNHFSYAGNAGTHGIFVDTSNNNIISSNTLFHNDKHGLYVFRSSRSSIVGNNCEGNEDGDGINITGDSTTNSDYNTLTGNVCYLNGSEGIEIVGGTDANKNIVLANQMISNVIGQLTDNGTATEVAHNIEV